MTATADPAAPGPVVVLAGGVGAARFLDGLVRVIPPAEVIAIVNVGDDLEIGGLHIAPDLDTVTYTLAGEVNPDTGWGRRQETFHALDTLRALGGPAWFALGDRDLGLHLYRTQRLREGAPLSAITAEIVRAFGLRCTLLPVTDDRLRTLVRTPAGERPFQDYFVRGRAQERVLGLRVDGADGASPAPGVCAALHGARAIVIAPSNPFLSIGPILAVPQIRDALLSAPAPVAAISPIIAGQAIKGPAAAILASLGHEVSALGVARLYRDLLDVFVIDATDAYLAPVIEADTGLRCVVAPTLMVDVPARAALARHVLAALSG